MTDDRGAAALAETPAMVHIAEDVGADPLSLAGNLLGEHGVFWPTGTDEYRELIRQYQAAVERLRAALELAETTMSREHDRCEGQCFDVEHANVRNTLRAALEDTDR